MKIIKTFFFFFLVLILVSTTNAGVIKVNNANTNNLIIKPTSQTSSSTTTSFSNNTNSSIYWGNYLYTNYPLNSWTPLIYNYSNVPIGAVSTFNASYDALNSTYGIFWYNHTLTLWNQYNIFWNNQTIGAVNYINNQLANNISFGNQTYNYNQTNTTFSYNMSSAFEYNHTITSNTSIWNTYNNLWGTTFNISYQNLNYNFTVLYPFMTVNETTITNITIFNTYDARWTNETTFKNNFSNMIIGCPTGQFVKNILANGSLNCSVDQSGGAGSFGYNMTINPSKTISLDINSSTRNGTVWTTIGNLTKRMEFPVSAGNNYTIDCTLLVSSNTTTNGVQINITTPSAPNLFMASFSHPTTATAGQWNYCEGNLPVCGDISLTSVVAGIPVDIRGILINGANSGVINISYRSELSNSESKVRKGSFCKVTLDNS